MPTPHPTYTPEALQEAIDAYFEANPTKPTIAGLAFHLGFASRQSMYDYENREETSYTIKRATLRIESFHEERLAEPNSTGSIFWLKNRGWRDKQEFDHTSNGETIKPDLSKLSDDELRLLEAMQRKTGVGA